MTYLIFDLIILILLVLALFRGYRVGLVMTLCGLLAYFVAIAGASVLSNTMSEPVGVMIQPAIQRNLEQTFQRHTQEELSSVQPPELAGSASVENGADSSVQTPEIGAISLARALELMQQSPLYQNFVQSFQAAVQNGVAKVTTNAAEGISVYVARQMAKLLLFVAGFFIILTVWNLFSHTLNLAVKLPGLKFVNHWSGALMGLVEWGILIFLIAGPLAGFLLTPEDIEKTYLLRFFCAASPLSALAAGPLAGFFRGDFITSS